VEWVVMMWGQSTMCAQVTKGGRVSTVGETFANNKITRNARTAVVYFQKTNDTTTTTVAGATAKH
jgi:hypothetical protein